MKAGPGKNREHDQSAVRKTRQTVDSTRAVVARVATASIWQLGFHNLANTNVGHRSAWGGGVVGRGRNLNTAASTKAGFVETARPCG